MRFKLNSPVFQVVLVIDHVVLQTIVRNNHEEALTAGGWLAREFAIKAEDTGSYVEVRQVI